MRKRQKLIIGLALLALIAIALITLCSKPSSPVNEPQYQGRHLSEWLSDLTVRPDLELGKEAVRSIGTNGLPYYLEWMQYEPTQLRLTVVPWLPRWLMRINSLSNWINPPAGWRAEYGYRGIQILGTNAVIAIPQLTMLMNDTTKPFTSDRAMGALCYLGTQSIPVFQAALTDTNRTNRSHIFFALQYMGDNGYSNECLPILLTLINDQDAAVQKEARLTLERWSPHLLTNVHVR